MINADLIQFAVNDFKRRSEAISTIGCPEIRSANYKFSQIASGITAKQLRDDFGNPLDAKAIYKISVDPDNVVHVKEAFEAARKVGHPGYSFARLNKNNDITSTVYIGSSRKLITRLYQHLAQVKGTSALNMRRWITGLKEGTVQVDVQLFDSTLENAVIQDVEDALWLKHRPLFGRQGPR